MSLPCKRKNTRAYEYNLKNWKLLICIYFKQNMINLLQNKILVANKFIYYVYPNLPLSDSTETEIYM